MGVSVEQTFAASRVPFTCEIYVIILSSDRFHKRTGET